MMIRNNYDSSKINIEAKFMQNAQRHLPVGACHALLDMLKNISDASDLSALSAILRLPSKTKPLAFSHVT